MSPLHTWKTLVRASIVACGGAIALGFSVQAQVGSNPLRLTIERISSTRPRLEGTAPMNPLWSPDSRHLAFVWDDTGMDDRNIWIVPAVAGEPRRLTDFAKEMPKSQRGPMDAEQLRQAMMLMRAGGLADLIWTPDSRALVVSHEGQLVQIPIDGSPGKRLTESPGMRTNLAFSPDGRLLSFLQQGMPWTLDPATGEMKQLARDVPAGIRFGSFKWSPDRRALALIFNERPNSVRSMNIPSYLGEEVTMTTIRRPNPGDAELGGSGLALLDVASGLVRLVRPQGRKGHRIGDYGWSPDSRQVLVDEFSEDTEHRWIWVVDVAADAAVREVWHDHRATRVTPFWHAVWRRDGKAILFLTNFEGWHHIYSLPLGGGKPTLLTPGEYEVVQDGLASNMDLMPATGDVFFVSTQKSPYERQVHRVSEMGGPVTQVTQLPGLHRPTIAPNGRYVATLRDDDFAPIDLYIADTQSRESERQVTRSPLKEFSQYQWAKPRYVTFKSHIDGDTLHARIVEPPNLDRTKTYPVVFGPVYRDTVRNSWGGLLQQYLVEEEQYIVVQVDMRGSIGYGRAFQEKVFKSVGGIEVEDLESAMRYLKTIPYADTDRAGIYGGSYGGLVTLMTVFKKPMLFKAAVAHCPASSLWHGPGLRYARSPQENPEAYRNASPISFGEDLQARLMIIHGTQDTNVLFQDTLKLIEKLVTLGKNFDFVVVPSAGHCGGPNVNYTYFTNLKHVEHFDRYVKNAHPPHRVF